MARSSSRWPLRCRARVFRGWNGDRGRTRRRGLSPADVAGAWTAGNSKIREPAPDDVERAILCGVNILYAVAAWSAASSGAGGPSVRIGIGAHYGEVFVGAVGDENMLEFTVLGDTVNLAERLERTTRAIDGVFVVSREILDAAGQTGRAYSWTPVSGQLLSGRLQGMEALSLQPDWRRRPSLGSRGG